MLVQTIYRQWGNVYFVKGGGRCQGGENMPENMVTKPFRIFFTKTYRPSQNSAGNREAGHCHTF